MRQIDCALQCGRRFATWGTYPVREGWRKIHAEWFCPECVKEMLAAGDVKEHGHSLRWTETPA